MSLIQVVGKWWREPDRFDWLTTFLRQRGAIRPAQMIMATVTGSAALVPLSDAIGGYEDVVVTLLCIACVLFTVGMTVFWLTRWPTRRQSAVTVVAGVLCIAAWSTTQADPTVAVLACTATAVTGGYIAFFHGPKLLIGNYLATAVAAAVAVARIHESVGMRAAVAAFWLIWFLNISVPLAIWAIANTLSAYVQRSSQDPLTGLLNRRGFIDTVADQLQRPTRGVTHVGMHLVDIDDFKRINDTYGHAAGDRVLLAMAELLRRHAPAQATICRSGGEEFLVAAISDSHSDLASVATRLCTAVSQSTHAITASVGSTTADLADLDGRWIPTIVEELIHAADTAMYAAKRNGGNQVQYR